MSSGAAFLLLLAAVFVVFGRACSFDSVDVDDWNNVFHNSYLNPPTLANVILFWNHDFQSLFIPVTYTFWALEAALFRGAESPQVPWPIPAGPFHAVNVLLHATNAFLVFLLLKRLMTATMRPADAFDAPSTSSDRMAVLCADPSTRSQARGSGRTERKNLARQNSRLPAPEYRIPALLGALLFTLHPVQVEPVVWVTGTKDVLSAFFSLLALLGCLTYAKHMATRSTAPESKRNAPGKTVDRALRSRTTVFVLAVAAYSTALFTKPSAVAVPLTALVLLALLPNVSLKATARIWAGWAALTLPIIFLNQAVQMGEDSQTGTAVIMRPAIALDAIGFYLAKLAAPIDLGMDYGRTPARVLESGDWRYAALAVAAGLSLLAFPALRRPLPLIAAGLFVTALSPVLGLVPFGFQYFSTVADRYLYMAMLGPALGVAWLATRFPTRGLRALLALWLLLLAFRSGAQVGVWRSSHALYEHALALNPDSAWMHNNLGFALMEEDKPAEALTWLDRAALLSPRYHSPVANSGLALARLGRLPEAIQRFRKSIALEPWHADVRKNLGMALCQTGQPEEGLAQLEQAIKLDPFYPQAHDDLGMALARSGNLRLAARHFAEAARLQSNNVSYREHTERALRQLMERGETPE